MERLSNRLLYKYKLVKRLVSDPAGGLQDLGKKQEQEKDELDELARDFNQEAEKGGDGSGDESDEFGVFDPNKHVSFDEKVRFAE